MAGNLLLLGGAAASMVAPGGVSSTPEAGEQYAVASSEYAQCATLATGHGSDETIGMHTQVSQSYSGDRMGYRMRSEWNGPLFTDEGIACGGIVNYRGSIEFRSGKYAERIDGNRFGIITKADAPSHSGAIRIRGAVSSKEICVLARELQGKNAPIVRLVRSEKRSYSEAGQPTVRTGNTVFLGTLSCDSANNSGGVGPQRGSGTGGVSTK